MRRIGYFCNLDEGLAMSGKTLPIIIAIAFSATACSGSGKGGHIAIDDAIVLDEAKIKSLAAEYKQHGRAAFDSAYGNVPFVVTAFVVSIHDAGSITGKVDGLGSVLFLMHKDQDAGVLKPSAMYRFKVRLRGLDTSNLNLVAFRDAIAIEEVKP